MSYIQKHLLSDEHIVYEGRMSGWYFAPSICSIIISIILIVIALGSSEPVGYEMPLLSIGVIWLSISLFVILKKLFYKLTSEFIITDKRCVLKRGFISIHVIDIALDKCEGIGFSQGFWGRIFQFGKITATTGGRTETFIGIDKPFEFRNKLNEQMDYYKKH